jgi:hypothetical protein
VDDKEILKKLHEYGDFLHITNFVLDAFRWIGWALVKLMVTAVDAIDSTLNSIITLNGFFNSEDIKDFYDQFEPVFWALLIASVVILGYCLMFGKVKEKNAIPINIMIAISFFLMLPTVMVQISDLTSGFVSGVNDGDVGAAGSKVVQKNVADLKLYAEDDFEEHSAKKPENNLSADKVMDITINETLDRDGLLKYQISQNVDGEEEVEKLDNGGWITDIGEEWYYRWHFNFWTILITLVVQAIAITISLIKIGKIIYNLAYTQIFGTLVAATDVAGGQRIKTVFMTVIGDFVTIGAIALSLKIYMFWTTWTSTLDVNAFATLFLLAAGSLAVIDGPKIVEKITGNDAGVKDAAQDIMAAYAGGKAVSAGAKGITQAGRNVASKAAGAAGGLKGTIAGFRSSAGDGSTGSGQSQSLYRGDNAEQNGSNSLYAGKGGQAANASGLSKAIGAGKGLKPNSAVAGAAGGAVGGLAGAAGSSKAAQGLAGSVGSSGAKGLGDAAKQSNGDSKAGVKDMGSTSNSLHDSRNGEQNGNGNKDNQFENNGSAESLHDSRAEGSTEATDGQTIENNGSNESIHDSAEGISTADESKLNDNQAEEKNDENGPLENNGKGSINEQDQEGKEKATEALVTSVPGVGGNNSGSTSGSAGAASLDNKGAGSLGNQSQEGDQKSEGTALNNTGPGSANTESNNNISGSDTPSLENSGSEGLSRSENIEPAGQNSGSESLKPLHDSSYSEVAATTIEASESSPAPLTNEVGNSAPVNSSNSDFSNQTHGSTDTNNDTVKSYQQSNVKPEPSSVNGVSNSSASSNVKKHDTARSNVERMGAKDIVFKEGHIRPKSEYTVGGQSRVGQQMNDSYAKSHNSGYNVGRKLGNITNKIKNSSKNLKR